MVVCAVAAFVLAVRAMPDVALGHELEADCRPRVAGEPEMAGARRAEYRPGIRPLTDTLERPAPPHGSPRIRE